MTAKQADALNPGDIVYGLFGGWRKRCIVLSVQHERRCRRLFVEFTTLKGEVVRTTIRHQNAWIEDDE